MLEGWTRLIFQSARSERRSEYGLATVNLTWMAAAPSAATSSSDAESLPARLRGAFYPSRAGGNRGKFGLTWQSVSVAPSRPTGMAMKRVRYGHRFRFSRDAGEAANSRAYSARGGGRRDRRPAARQKFP